MSSENWQLDISSIDGPRYLAVAGEIARAIDSGELAPGAQLPPLRELAEQLGVTVGTVSRAYSLARKRRLIVGEVGRGTFVQGPVHGERGKQFIPQQSNSGVDLSTFGSALSEGLNQRMARSLAELSARASTLTLHKYPPGAGALSHRLAGTAWLARAGLNVSPEEVLITNGAQEAVAVCLATLARPGDTVLTEEMTYSGLKSLAGIQGLHLRGVAMDSHGMLPDALESVAIASASRVVYLQPTIHNPTAASMPESRRRQIAAVAKRLDLTLIEDDAAASCLVQRPVTVAALVPDRTCYITSLSKSVSPTLRVAYVTAGQDLSSRLAHTFYTMSLGASSITVELAALLIGSGAAAEIASAYLASMSKGLDLATQVLSAKSIQGKAGAFFVWLALPERWDAEDFVRMAKLQGIAVPHMDSFLADRVTSRRGIRISLNPSLSPKIFRKALTQLRALMDAPPPPRQTIV